MRGLLFIAMAMLLSGCASQVFLDGGPRAVTPSIAGGVIERRIHAVSSGACIKQASALPYQLLEHGRQGWVRTCAKVEGFAYQPGNDYFLQVTEHSVHGSPASVRLILKEVIEEHPHTRD